MTQINNDLKARTTSVASESSANRLSPSPRSWHGRIIGWIFSSFNHCVGKIADLYKRQVVTLPPSQPAVNLQARKTVLQSADMVQSIFKFLPSEEAAKLRLLSKAFNSGSKAAAKLELRGETVLSFDELMRYAQLLGEDNQVKQFSFYDFCFGKTSGPSSLAHLSPHLKNLRQIDLLNTKISPHVLKLLQTLSPSILEKIEVLNLVGSTLDQPYSLLDSKKNIFPNLNKIIGSAQRIDLSPIMSSLFKDGKGVYIPQLGEEYEGVWKDKKFAGTATFTFQVAAKLGFKELKHTYADGVLQRTSTCVYSDGANYQGEMINDIAHGIGTYTNPDGSKYQGNWVNGLHHGQGTYTNPDGSNYEGSWLDGMRHGQGTYTYLSGTKYEGNWINGLQRGQGTCTYISGAKYKGNWVNGLQGGQGTYIDSDGEKYEGNWRGGVLHGQGTYTYSDGSKYEGRWADDRKHGQGIYIYPDGSKYEGEWVHGKRHGEGTYTYPDGSKYEGRWVDDEQEGQGTYTFENGDRYEER
jgi:hypothetical protein